MCIVVRYVDEENMRINESLFKLLNVCDGDEHRKSDAKTLFEKLIDAFEEAQIPLHRFFSFCSDTCAVMTGCHIGVGQRLTKKISGIKILKCLAYIQDLCAHNAIKEIPEIFEKIPNLVYCYSAKSYKKSDRWIVIQMKSKLKVLEIIQPFEQRWLSYFQCMIRIYRRWPTLLLYFQEECKGLDLSQETESLPAKGKIFKYLNNPMNQVYHLFLVSVYWKLYLLNLKMQFIKPSIPENLDMVRILYIELLKMFMNEMHIEKYVNNVSISEINIDAEAHWKSLELIQLDDEVQSLLDATSATPV